MKQNKSLFLFLMWQPIIWGSAEEAPLTTLMDYTLDIVQVMRQKRSREKTLDRFNEIKDKISQCNIPEETNHRYSLDKKQCGYETGQYTPLDLAVYFCLTELVHLMVSCGNPTEATQQSARSILRSRWIKSSKGTSNVAPCNRVATALILGGISFETVAQTKSTTLGILYNKINLKIAMNAAGDFSGENILKTTRETFEELDRPCEPQSTSEELEMKRFIREALKRRLEIPVAKETIPSERMPKTHRPTIDAELLPEEASSADAIPPMFQGGFLERDATPTDLANPFGLGLVPGTPPASEFFYGSQT